mgnify:FL=1
MLGQNTDTYRNIRPLIDFIICGSVVCIDPSIGSTSSMPGWAIYRSGELIQSGIFTIDPKIRIWEKARELHRNVYNIYKKFKPDILVYEEIPDQNYRQGGATGFNVKAHATLLKAVGAILSVPGTSYAVGLRPIVWKKYVRPEYRKGDKEDAIEIGYAAIQISKEIKAEQGRRR